MQGWKDEESRKSLPFSLYLDEKLSYIFKHFIDYLVFSSSFKGWNCFYFVNLSKLSFFYSCLSFTLVKVAVDDLNIMK